MRAIRSIIDAIVYPDRLGRIIANINSLEVEIRVFLLVELKGVQNANLWAENLHTLKVGDEVEINPFTNYCSLAPLIKNYNEIALNLPNSPTDLSIDIKIVDLRDNLAHGRVFFSIPKTISPFRLIKFGQANSNLKTNVTFTDLMTINKLDELIKCQKPLSMTHPSPHSLTHPGAYSFTTFNSYFQCLLAPVW